MIHSNVQSLLGQDLRIDRLRSNSHGYKSLKLPEMAMIGPHHFPFYYTCTKKNLLEKRLDNACPGSAAASEAAPKAREDLGLGPSWDSSN